MQEQASGGLFLSQVEGDLAWLAKERVVQLCKISIDDLRFGPSFCCVCVSSVFSHTRINASAMRICLVRSTELVTGPRAGSTPLVSLCDGDACLAVVQRSAAAAGHHEEQKSRREWCRGTKTGNPTLP